MPPGARLTENCSCTPNHRGGVLDNGPGNWPGDNHLLNYLKLVCTFEHGNWDDIAQASVDLEVHQDVLFSIYQQAVTWGGSMMQEIENV